MLRRERKHLCGGTRESPGLTSMYEEAGFVYDRAKGKNHCVMTMTVEVERR